MAVPSQNPYRTAKCQRDNDLLDSARAAWQAGTTARGHRESRKRTTASFHFDVTPFPLPEAEHRQRATGQVAEDDGGPHAGRIELAESLESGANPERNDHL